MTRKSILIALTVVGFALSSSSIHADVRADQKNRVELAGVLGRMMNMFGGKGAREGVVSTVAVKGDRKAMTTESTTQIIDLAEEKVYDVDLKKKSYRVTTFAELRRRWEEAQKKAEENARREPRASAGNEKPAERDPNQKEVEVDFDLKNTGQQKSVNGFDAHETVMTITVREKGKTLDEAGGMVLTSDMWLTPTVAAMKEITQFDMRYAQKLYGAVVGMSPEQMAAAQAMYPMLKDAIGRMSAEGVKVEGTPIQTTTTIDTVKSKEQMSQEAKSSSTQDDSDSRPQGGVGGLLGGLTKKIAPKKSDDGGDKQRATFMTMTHDVLKVTTEVSAADVAVPAGFKENK